MKSNLLKTVIIVAACSTAMATFAPITESDSWTAGTDSLNIFYGSGYDNSLGWADLGVWNSYSPAGRRAIFYAAQITQAGTYNYSFDSKFTNYNYQYNYFNVYLFNDGVVFPLTPDPAVGMLPIGAAQILTNYAPPSQDENQWYNYSYDFDITQEQVDSYQYVGFFFVGSKTTDSQVLAYDNFITNIPEPMTVIILAAGALGVMKPRKKHF